MGMNHCRSCNTTFASLEAFDMHRIGDFETPVYKLKKDGTSTNHVETYLPSTRRCMTQAEIIQAGMVQNDKGWWMTGVDLSAIWAKKGKDDQDEPAAEEASA